MTTIPPLTKPKDSLLPAKVVNEPLLTENPNRFVLFPIKYNDIWQMYKQQMASFWTAEEIDLGSDMTDWEKLTDNERHFNARFMYFFYFTGLNDEN